jgi:hypothetical protein
MTLLLVNFIKLLWNFFYRAWSDPTVQTRTCLDSSVHYYPDDHTSNYDIFDDTQHPAYTSYHYYSLTTK